MPQSNREDHGMAAVPMGPALLKRIGQWPQFPAPPAGFQPDGDWTQRYRLLTSHGYLEAESVGFLRLRRERSAGDKFFLQVDQHIRNNDGTLHMLRAEAHCRVDPVASLLDWKLTSRFTEADGREIQEAGGDEAGRVHGGGAEITRNGRVTRLKFSGALTSNFGLFEAVQRLDRTNAPPPPFDLLEGLDVPRRGHRFSFDADSGVSGLRRLHQIGRGMLPYEYWIDEHRRLALVASHTRAYLLDEKAEDFEKPGPDGKGKRKGRKKGQEENG